MSFWKLLEAAAQMYSRQENPEAIAPESLHDLEMHQIAQDCNELIAESKSQNMRAIAEQHYWDQVIVAAEAAQTQQIEQLRSYAQQHQISTIEQALSSFEQACREAEERGFNA